MLEHLPLASFFRQRAVCRWWREAAGSPASLVACAAIPARDPWFLMLSGRQEERPGVAFDTVEGTWVWCRGALLPVPVDAAGELEAEQRVAAVNLKAPHDQHVVVLLCSAPMDIRRITGSYRSSSLIFIDVMLELADEGGD